MVLSYDEKRLLAMHLRPQKLEQLRARVIAYRDAAGAEGLQQSSGAPGGRGGHADPTLRAALASEKMPDDVREALGWIRAVYALHERVEGTSEAEILRLCYGRKRACLDDVCRAAGVSRATLYLMQDRLLFAFAILAAQFGVFCVDCRVRGAGGWASGRETRARRMS